MEDVGVMSDKPSFILLKIGRDGTVIDVYVDCTFAIR